MNKGARKRKKSCAARVSLKVGDPHLQPLIRFNA